MIQLTNEETKHLLKMLTLIHKSRDKLIKDIELMHAKLNKIEDLADDMDMYALNVKITLIGYPDEPK